MAHTNSRHLLSHHSSSLSSKLVSLLLTHPSLFSLHCHQLCCKLGQLQMHQMPQPEPMQPGDCWSTVHIFVLSHDLCWINSWLLIHLVSESLCGSYTPHVPGPGPTLRFSIFIPTLDSVWHTPSDCHLFPSQQRLVISPQIHTPWTPPFPCDDNSPPHVVFCSILIPYITQSDFF